MGHQWLHAIVAQFKIHFHLHRLQQFDVENARGQRPIPQILVFADNRLVQDLFALQMFLGESGLPGKHAHGKYGDVDHEGKEDMHHILSTFFDGVMFSDLLVCVQPHFIDKRYTTTPDEFTRTL